MRIVVSGSMRTQEQVSQMQITVGELRGLGHEVFSLQQVSQDAVTKSLDTAAAKSRVMRAYFDEIKRCDAVLVFNPPKNGIDGYIGGSTLCEMAVAFANDKTIFTMYDLPALEALAYTPEIYGLQPVVLHGDLSQLKVAA